MRHPLLPFPICSWPPTVMEPPSGAFPQTMVRGSFLDPNSRTLKPMLALGIAGLRDETPVASIPDLLVATDSYGTALGRVSTNDGAREFLGSEFKDIET